MVDRESKLRFPLPLSYQGVSGTHMKMKFGVIISGLCACLAFTGCSGEPVEAPAESLQPSTLTSSASPISSASPSPTGPTSYWDILVGTDVTTEEVCDSYEKLINKYEVTSSKRNAAMKGKLKDAYLASSFRKGKNWLTADFVGELNSDIERAVASALDSVSGGRAADLSDMGSYEADSMQLCGFSGRLAKVRMSVSKVYETAGKIVAKAKMKPWYSKGYMEYSDGLAIKYTTFSGGDPCGYSSCRYGKVTVQSRDGCLRGLYGEMNFLDSNGTIRDWDIDSVSVIYPGQKATLTFISYSNYGSGKIQLTSLSCY